MPAGGCWKKCPAWVSATPPSSLLLLHIPLRHHHPPPRPAFPQAVFVTYIMRRVLRAVLAGDDAADDKDYYGNKRLELAGSLIALLFEDLFKNFNAQVCAWLCTIVCDCVRLCATVCVCVCVCVCAPVYVCCARGWQLECLSLGTE